MVRNRLLAAVIGVALLSPAIVATPVMADPGLVSVPASLSAGNPSGKTRADGQPLSRAGNRTTAKPLKNLKSATAPECPPTVHCVFTPAAYHNNNPADPVDYGNYDIANRPYDGMKIKGVIIHDIEGTCQAAIAAFQDPTFFVSTHYVICADGTIHQMVRNKDVAWHAGNWLYNSGFIGIEHEGHVALGDFTSPMYRASAELVKYLAGKYGFSLNRQNIVGHDNVPAVRTSGIPFMHTDPGPYWNWQGYMALLGAPVLPSALPGSPVVVIAPVWPLHKQPVTGCSGDTCVPAGGPFPANFVYLRTAPNQNAPLFTDLVLGPGSTGIGNTAARAYHGQKFAVAQRQFDTHGIWYQIWYAGGLAWFYSPWSAPTAFPASGQYITPRPGLASIAVYGRAVPEQSEYPADFVPPPGSVPYPSPLAYTIAAEQRFTVSEANPLTGHYFAWTYNSSLPYDHTLFVGAEKYIRIQYNGREAFVKRADVVLAS